MNNFNGQINISRDLRANKQTVIGKYDLTDIFFLSLGIGVAILVAYVLGFSYFKVVDEFTAILISIVPMVLIISLGFKKVAGIRNINYLRMKFIDKKTKFRLNRKIDNTNTTEKYLLGFEIENKYVNKYINRFLQYENLSLLSVRYIRDDNSNTIKAYFILDLRYKNDDDIFIDLFEKFSLNSEIKGLSNEALMSLKKDMDIKYKNKRIKVYMLNLYDNKVYKKYIGSVKRFSDVICYFKKDGKKKYVNTFLIIEEEIKKGKKLTKLEKIEKLSDEYGVILDRLVREQNAGKVATSYTLTNPFNAYRVYK